MKRWQKKRNYRRIKDENGNVLACIITVDGIDVKVSEEVYQAYSSMDRRERYENERISSAGVISLDGWEDAGVLPCYTGAEMAPSAEKEYIKAEEAQERMELMELACKVLRDSLEEADRLLIHALYFERISTRAYARRIGVTQRAVIKRRDRILRDMKKIMEKLLN